MSGPIAQREPSPLMSCIAMPPRVTTHLRPTAERPSVSVKMRASDCSPEGTVSKKVDSRRITAPYWYLYGPSEVVTNSSCCAPLGTLSSSSVSVCR